MNTVRVALAEDNVLLREGMSRLVAANNDFELVGVASDLPQLLALDRRAVRRRFEQRFSSARMATDYVALYRSLLERPLMLEREMTVPRSRPVLETI